MSTRLDKRFATLKSEGRAAFVTFITASDPDFDSSLELLNGLPGAGADVIELGMPFTDPMADGPAIQASSQRALKGGATLKRTLELVRGFRDGDNDTPIVLMGYYNPIYHMGVPTFLDAANAPGVDGLIVVDLPPEEDDELCVARARCGPQLHSPRDADDRRQAASRRSREHFGLRLLRLDQRHHGFGHPGHAQGRLRRRAHQTAHLACPSRLASASRHRNRPTPLRTPRTAPSSGPPSSARLPTNSTQTENQGGRRGARADAGSRIGRRRSQRPRQSSGMNGETP